MKRAKELARRKKEETRTLTIGVFTEQLYFVFPERGISSDNRTRRCSLCGKHKSLRFFYKDAGSPLGYSYQCKACRNKSIDKYRSTPQGWSVAIIERLRFRSEKKGFACEVDREDLIERMEAADFRCEMSGIRLVIERGRGYDNYNSASVDRIDNDRGYVKGNIRIVCLLFNKLKGMLPDGKFDVQWAIQQIQERDAKESAKDEERGGADDGEMCSGHTE